MRLITLSAAASAAFALAACTTTGNIERGALGGAAAGAAIGAIVGNNTGDGDAGDGAEKGAAIGAIAGGVYGLGRDQAARQPQYGGQPTYGGPQPGYGATPPPRYYDQYARRYYTIDPRTGRTYWEDGSPRS